MAEPNGYIQGSNGEPIELVDSKARAELPKKLTRPATAQVGDYLRIKAIGADGSMEVEAVPAPTGGSVTIPTKVSAFENDAGYVDEQRVQELLAEFPSFDIQVVQELPAVGEEKTIYLVPFASEDGQYLEYLYVGGSWEVVGRGKDSGENLVQGIGITTIMAITQTKYDELVMLEQVDETTLYIIKPESEDEPDLTMIPVLRSDGVAWINLGVAAPSGAWYEVCFRGISDMDTYDAIFGNSHTNVGTAGGLVTRTWVTGSYSDSGYATFGQGAINLTTKHTFKVTKSALILDGDTENARAITAGTATYSNPLYLFATNKYSDDRNRIDCVSGISAIDFFYLRIWSSEDKILHNYVPAQDSEGVACIYDTVEKAYLYNAAESGAFEYREELEES